MFRREVHRVAAEILAGLDAGLLGACGALFAGGTRLVLDLDEYRESQDLDFLCADPAGYADLRARARRDGLGALFAPERVAAFGFPREVRTDQYGIRSVVACGPHRVKLQVVFGARIRLDPPVHPAWSPVPCLALVDAYAEKLLANSDRWPDRQFLSRDLIDLAQFRQKIGPIPAEAWAKAEGAYGAAVRNDLAKAAPAFLESDEHRRRCYEGLRIDWVKAIEVGVRRLISDLEAG